MIYDILLFFGEYGIFFVIIISLLNFKNEFKSLIALGLAMGIAYAISTFFYTPPPFVAGNFQPLIPHAPSSSFPSHHATAGFALSASTFNTNAILGIISSVVAVLMSIGRIYAGIHYNYDIIGAVLIGGLCAVFAYGDFIDKTLKKITHKLFKKKSKKIK